MSGCVHMWINKDVCSLCVCVRVHRTQVLWTVGWLSSRLPSCRLVHLQRDTGYVTSSVRKKWRQKAERLCASSHIQGVYLWSLGTSTDIRSLLYYVISLIFSPSLALFIFLPFFLRPCLFLGFSFQPTLITHKCRTIFTKITQYTDCHTVPLP